MSSHSTQHWDSSLVAATGSDGLSLILSKNGPMSMVLTGCRVLGHTVHRGGVSLLWSGLDQIRHQKAGLPASALWIWIKFYVYDYRFLSCWGSIKFFPISPFFPITSWQDLATGDQSEASIRVTWSLSNNQRLVLVETVCPRHMGLKNYLKTISFSSLIVKIAAITTK